MNSKITQDNTVDCLNGQGSVPKGHSSQSIHLKTIDDVRLEMAKVYRDMKNQKIVTSDGTRLVYVLSQIGKFIELHDIENRLKRLEVANVSEK